ncbi:30S ribosomal protein S8 [candidate division WWE3 bacterium RBG_13_37_7]|uniref:Small ribosomal subunit protein uS8 n=1 Tax=candidate division WWE3 bacterium RBG_13_37_7 TaxID=1802609 RepID=A0A1F4U0E9_UNCKA|nr:MAG: 30S ribosomal protein S8 [candidate division WWE3 bacterium RBG_13_37_7]
MSLDVISNMLSSLKNAAMAKKPYIEVMYSKESESIAKVLQEKQFLSEVKTFKPSGKSYKMLHLELAHNGDFYNITDIKRVSKPGHRIYKKYADLKRVAGGLGLLVVSTSRGMMSGETAKNKKLGGEVICEVY